MNYCFGIDIGGTTVKMGLFKFDGEVVDKWEIKTRTEYKGKAILPDIANSIERKLKEKGLEKGDILGIGLGVPAPVDDAGVVKSTANLGWGYKEVKHEMEELTGLHVRVGNDANVAGLGEMWRGGGLGMKNLIMVTLGTGVGGGIIINGKIVTGAHGAGGEIGHICVNYHETQKCGCGKTGCLEQYASATGIARLARERLSRDDAKTKLREGNVNAKTVFDAVKEGDTVAIEIASEFGTYLGRALANLAAAVDPDVIVIGGGVSRAGEVLFDYITEPYMEHAFFANKECRFELARLGNDAGIYGAAKLILE